ncbi:MAG: response regulator [Calditrichaeota bacterium]|nr:response regulator [Calditrichota bacterium]
MESTKKLLLVTRSSEELEELQSDLTQVGYNVLRASDTPSVLRMIEHHSFDLIISQLQLSSENAIDLCWYIRTVSKQPLIPFVILSQTADKEIELNAYRAGVDIFLTPPISFRTLFIRMEAFLIRSKKMQRYFSRNSNGLFGLLRSIRLIDLIQLFHMNQKTGALWLSRDYERGLLFFRQGNLIFARLGTMEGLTAVFEMANWQEGFFNFDDQTEEPGENITLSTMEVILQIGTREDENGAGLSDTPQPVNKTKPTNQPS